MKLLLYCCKQPHKLFNTDRGFVLSDFGLGDAYKDKTLLNGKIVAECDYEVEEIKLIEAPEYAGSEDVCMFFETNTLNEYNLCKKSCLNEEQLNRYLDLYKEKDVYGYAIHIKNLHIFDEPKELNEYITKQCQYAKCSTCKYGKNNINCSTIDTPITKAPQNMMYAYNYSFLKSELEKYIIISIQPQWLCKILNGEKIIEVRKIVLKGML